MKSNDNKPFYAFLITIVIAVAILSWAAATKADTATFVPQNDISVSLTEICLNSYLFVTTVSVAGNNAVNTIQVIDKNLHPIQCTPIQGSYTNFIRTGQE